MSFFSQPQPNLLLELWRSMAFFDRALYTCRGGTDIPTKWCNETRTQCVVCLSWQKWINIKSNYALIISWINFRGRVDILLRCITPWSTSVVLREGSDTFWASRYDWYCRDFSNVATEEACVFFVLLFWNLPCDVVFLNDRVLILRPIWPLIRCLVTLCIFWEVE